MIASARRVHHDRRAVRDFVLDLFGESYPPARGLTAADGEVDSAARGEVSALKDVGNDHY
ncbi:hypothetical protein [Mycobacterium xenopi]|uniref:hypothetical protein n=1 Tax=Mycobacterium xenopi TaxID=1789 RepID=UPI0002DF9578|nr:hypothetical protein [Mycobacterium xenopi]